MILIGLAVSVLSLGAIGYEILLLRLLNIVQWHHFVSMIVSLALLGYGTSGTFVALFQKRLLSRFKLSFILNALGFGISTVACFSLAQAIPFNPLEIFWDKRQFLHLIGVYGLLSIPFFCAANCVCISLSHFRDKMHLIYRFDLLGAGSGAVLILLLMFVLPPEISLRVFPMLGFLAAGLACLHRADRWSSWGSMALACLGILLALGWPKDWLSCRVSEYKGLSVALRVPGTEILSERFSPLGWIVVVRSSKIPFRYAPGLSLACPFEPPEQLGLFTDGDAFSPITRYQRKDTDPAFLDYLTWALPYHLVKRPKVLILGAGGGMDVLMALSHRAKEIHAVEINPQVIELVKRTYSDFAGHIYQQNPVRLHEDEARGFLSKTRERFDLIQLSLLDSYASSVSGASALNASYLYTTEAIEEDLRHLRPGGFVVITRWLKMPPRDALKLFATAVAALEKSSLGDPESSLALIRSWKTTTLLVKKGSLSFDEVDAIKAFCKTRSFDLAYYPGMKRKEANRFNILERPYFYEGATALVGPRREDFMRRYKYLIRPSTDDRPYFFHTFKWKMARELLSLRGGRALLEWGYPILVATFCQAVVVSFLFVLVPLMMGAERVAVKEAIGRSAAYFFCLGLAFLFVEMVSVQRFILFLHHPVYAAATVLSAFLVFAGLGSGFSRRWALFLENRCGPLPGVGIAGAVVAIGAISCGHMLWLPAALRHWMGLPTLIKTFLSILFISPLAFFMGMPFPLGLYQVSSRRPHFVPWAWGINGCASVVSPLLATLLSMSLGFRTVGALALVLYGCAALCLWGPLERKG